MPCNYVFCVVSNMLFYSALLLVYNDDEIKSKNNRYWPRVWLRALENVVKLLRSSEIKVANFQNYILRYRMLHRNCVLCEVRSTAAAAFHTSPFSKISDKYIATGFNQSPHYGRTTNSYRSRHRKCIEFVKIIVSRPIAVLRTHQTILL